MLLSGLLFPGTGQLLFKRYVNAVIFSGIALATCYIVINNIFNVFTDISVQIAQGEIPADVFAINEAVSTELEKGHGDSIAYATFIFLIAWLIGLADTYRIGQQYEEHEDNE